MIDLPVGPFRTISADPPWPYDAVGEHGPIKKSLTVDGARMQRGPGQAGYLYMSMDDLLALPVSDVADDSAHLYLWVTNSFLAEGLELVKAWGFIYKTTVTWVKMKHSWPPEVSMKTGYYFRGATEHVLFGVRGSCPPPDGLALPTAYLHDRIPRHSAKPDKFYRDVVEPMSPGPRLEMFGRKPRDGWTVWGNQVEDEECPGLAGA